jgi:beta-phosphoglucomutase-like phosphatase (HAD superfamily)
MNDQGRLAHALAGGGPIFLDFDGPICGVFSGYPAQRVAAELRKVLETNRVALPECIQSEADPLMVLRWTATLNDASIIREVEDALCAAEMRAVAVAEPTPFAREVISAAHECGRRVAVVSNNSAPAIEAYLQSQGLAGQVWPIVGRVHSQPDRMKPDPTSIFAAIDALNSDAGTCVLIGDSLSDVTACQAAGVRIVGYANKPHKGQAFTEAGADAVVTSMEAVAVGLLGVGSPNDLQVTTDDDSHT